LLIWLFPRRIKRARILFVSILAIAILIAGSCPGSDGGGEELTTEELYELIWINSNATKEWDADAVTALGNHTVTIE